MIIKKEKKGPVTVYHVKKNYNQSQMDKNMNKKINHRDIKLIINHDADVYDEDGKLLLKFRKDAIKNKEVIDAFYDNVIDHAKQRSITRKYATGTRKNVPRHPSQKVMTNIIGFFDGFVSTQRIVLNRSHYKPTINVRECMFNTEYPEKFLKAVPMIQQIDKLYEKLVPEKYKEQVKKAKQTTFKIPGTSFTTVTLNVNYQTSIHKDAGDDMDGFGNLSVIEHGEYTGGETCFPQYGIGVDVRTGDVLFMDVHQPHANMPIQKKTDDAVRLSIVCYLRTKIWENSKDKTKQQQQNHLNKTRKILKHK